MAIMDLIKVLKKERLKQKLTQEDLADKAGISSHTISNIELGNSYPTLRLFVELASELGLEVLLRSTKKVVSDLHGYSTKQLLKELERRNNDD
jgi:transcriptional regulator with XRE-family HTH domain